MKPIGDRQKAIQDAARNSGAKQDRSNDLSDLPRKSRHRSQGKLFGILCHGHFQFIQRAPCRFFQKIYFVFCLEKIMQFLIAQYIVVIIMRGHAGNSLTSAGESASSLSADGAYGFGSQR
ncbi:hypothetical protein CKA34_12905 [Rhizobium sp. 11515TR]|nr:hypothetical protein CKA34_12905 [Rhizobium sp. 11515TR]